MVLQKTIKLIRSKSSKLRSGNTTVQSLPVQQDGAETTGIKIRVTKSREHTGPRRPKTSLHAWDNSDVSDEVLGENDTPRGITVQILHSKKKAPPRKGRESKSQTDTSVRISAGYEDDAHISSISETKGSSCKLDLLKFIVSSDNKKEELGVIQEEEPSEDKTCVGDHDSLLVPTYNATTESNRLPRNRSTDTVRGCNVIKYTTSKNDPATRIINRSSPTRNSKETGHDYIAQEAPYLTAPGTVYSPTSQITSKATAEDGLEIGSYRSSSVSNKTKVITVAKLSGDRENPHQRANRSTSGISYVNVRGTSVGLGRPLQTIQQRDRGLYATQGRQSQQLFYVNVNNGQTNIPFSDIPHTIPCEPQSKQLVRPPETFSPPKKHPTKSPRRVPTSPEQNPPKITWTNTYASNSNASVDVHPRVHHNDREAIRPNASNDFPSSPSAGDSLTPRKHMSKSPRAVSKSPERNRSKSPRAKYYARNSMALLRRVDVHPTDSECTPRSVTRSSYTSNKIGCSPMSGTLEKQNKTSPLTTRSIRRRPHDPKRYILRGVDDKLELANSTDTVAVPCQPETQIKAGNVLYPTTIGIDAEKALPIESNYDMMNLSERGDDFEVGRGRGNAIIVVHQEMQDRHNQDRHTCEIETARSGATHECTADTDLRESNFTPSHSTNENEISKSVINLNSKDNLVIPEQNTMLQVECHLSSTSLCEKTKTDDHERLPGLKTLPDDIAIVRPQCIVTPPESMPIIVPSNAIPSRCTSVSFNTGDEGALVKHHKDKNLPPPSDADETEQKAHHRHHRKKRRNKEGDIVHDKQIQADPQKLIDYLKLVKENESEYMALRRIGSRAEDKPILNMLGIASAYKRGHHESLSGKPESLVVQAAYELGNKTPHPICQRYERMERMRAELIARASLVMHKQIQRRHRTDPHEIMELNSLALPEEMSFTPLERARAELEIWMKSLSAAQQIKAKELAIKAMGEGKNSMRKWWISQRYCRYLRQRRGISKETDIID